MIYKTKFEYELNSETAKESLYNMSNREKEHTADLLGINDLGKYRFEKEYDCIRVVKAQNGIGGVRPIPDAILTITESKEGTYRLNAEIRLSDVWLFFIIILHLILFAVGIALIFVGDNPVLDIIGILVGVGVLQLMIYETHFFQVEVYRVMLKAIAEKVNAMDLDSGYQ